MQTIPQAPTTFRSVLYRNLDDEGPAGRRDAPAYFRDLNLDQIVEAIVKGRDEYDLKPFFHQPLTSDEAIRYRHEVMQDLEDSAVFACITSFAKNMRLMREKLVQAGKLPYTYQKERWFLHAIETYCATIAELHDRLDRLELRSQALKAFREYVAGYATSDRFLSLGTAVCALTADLERVRYRVHIKGNGFRVRRYDDEADYSAEVAATFAKFRQGEAKDYRAKYRETVEMNHVEAIILDFVALLYPDIFASLVGFVAANQDFIDPTIRRFDREVQFYVAYLEYMATFTPAGLTFSYPQVSAADKHVRCDDAFDLALATKLFADGARVVRNDFELTGRERILIVSGPNQGGKTTFARAFGQLHHLASIGCPVPGRNARLLLFDGIFTHFEREETIENLRGKLEDDLIRIHEILRVATPRSIVILNEIFNSTTLHDELFLSRNVMERIVELDVLCVCVTFLDELTSLDKTVSMVSTVQIDDPTIRTFKVVRQQADGRAYAIAIAEKYGLTYERVKGRIDG